MLAAERDRLILGRCLAHADDLVIKRRKAGSFHWSQTEGLKKGQILLLRQLEPSGFGKRHAIVVNVLKRKQQNVIDPA